MAIKDVLVSVLIVLFLGMAFTLVARILSDPQPGHLLRLPRKLVIGFFVAVWIDIMLLVAL